MTPRYSHYTTLNPCDKSTSLGRNRYSGLFSQVLLINPLTITVTITRKRRHPPFFRAATLFKLYGISPSQPLLTLARPFAKAYHNSVFLPEGSLKLKTWKPLATSHPWYRFRGGGGGWKVERKFHLTTSYLQFPTPPPPSLRTL